MITFLTCVLKSDQIINSGDVIIKENLFYKITDEPYNIELTDLINSDFGDHKFVPFKPQMSHGTSSDINEFNTDFYQPALPYRNVRSNRLNQLKSTNLN